MRTPQWIVLIIMILLINNVLLIRNLDYFYPSLEQTTPQPNPPSVPSLVPEPRNTTTIIESPEGALVSTTKTRATLAESTPEQVSFEQDFKQFSETQTFLEIMDQYTLSSGQRMMQQLQQFSSMSAQELYDAFISSENMSDKELALQGLAQGGWGELSSSQIKEIYLESADSWYGGVEALRILLERDDPEALLWAKEALNKPTFGLSGGYDLVGLLYQKDPEFIENYVASLDVDKFNNTSRYTMTFIQEPELQKIFYEKNLDKILVSNNSTLFQMPPYNLDMELSSDQQSKVADLLSSRNRSKRRFALSVVNLVKDEQLLRQGYESLTRDRDRQTMLAKFISARNNDPTTRALVRQLAADSNNPQIRALAEAIR